MHYSIKFLAVFLIAKMFKDKKTYIFVLVIPNFSSHKMLLQSLKPLLHVLHHSIQRLHKSLLLKFIEAEVLSAVASNLDLIGINL